MSANPSGFFFSSRRRHTRSLCDCSSDVCSSDLFQDVKPPDMGGYECYRRLRAARPESTVALTTGFGYDVAHSIVKARHDGMKYVLFKPFRERSEERRVGNECRSRGAAED